MNEFNQILEGLKILKKYSEGDKADVRIYGPGFEVMFDSNPTTNEEAKRLESLGWDKFLDDVENICIWMWCG